MPCEGDPLIFATLSFQAQADILNKTFAEQHRLKINDSFTQENSYYDPFFTTVEDEGTTHVSVIDRDGNAVAATDTINYAYVERNYVLFSYKK